MKRPSSEKFIENAPPDAIRSDRYTSDIIHKIGARPGSGEFEIHAEMPFELGTGRLRSMNLREGLTVDVLETCFHADFSSTVYLTHPTVSFPFYLSGVKRMTCASASGKETILFDSRVGGLCSAAYYRELEYEFSIKGGVRNVHVCVNISPSLLQTFLDDRSDGLPGAPRDIAHGADRKEYGHTAPLTPPMSSALYEMLHCPYTGPIRKIFMEGKALELVAHKLAQIQAEKKSPGPTRFDRRDDLDRIYHAENLLNERLEKPPMLSELAGAVGVSYKKLNAGFREVFGTTVFGRLRHLRLERARYLMERQGKNVAEAAFTVGYNSLPSFSHAFSKFFGVPPGRCLKR